MIVEYIRYQIPQDQAEAFVSAYEAAAQYLRASDACLGYEISQCTEDRSQFIVRISWQSEAAHLQGFRRSELFKPFLSAVRAFIPQIQEMRHYEPTTLRWTR